MKELREPLVGAPEPQAWTKRELRTPAVKLEGFKVTGPTSHLGALIIKGARKSYRELNVRHVLPTQLRQFKRDD